jgi:lysophospholipase L1-like esterase
MKRVLRVLLQIVVTAELTLQLLGLLLPDWSSRAGELSGASDAATILCVGDSHTYGAPLPPEESYPAQLQSLLDARAGGRYRVVNLGVPGMNSAMMASRFEANLARHRPQLVILWAGGNNIWNENETESWDAEGEPDRLYRALLRLKLVRLVRFLGSGVARAGDGRAELLAFKPTRVGNDFAIYSSTWRLGDEVIQMESPPGSQVSLARAEKGARNDLRRMVRLARAYGIPVLLVTYPYKEFSWANGAARDVARELDVELLDTRDDLERAVADGYTAPELIVFAAGPHPRRVLYGYISASMLPVALRLLGAE